MTKAASSSRGMKIWAQGLLIICIPLVFEIVFGTTLMLAIQQADRDTQMEYHAKLVMSQSTQLGKYFYEAVMGLVYKATGRGNAETKLDKAVNDIKVTLENLRTLPPVSEDERDCLRKIALLGDEELQLITHARVRMLDNKDGMFGAPDEEMRAQAELTMSEIMAQSNLLSGYEKNVRSEAASKSRAQVLVCLFIGMVLNVVLTIVAGLFFYKNFVKRIRVISENCVSLKNHGMLAPRLSGQDEISYVDHYFHEMASHLKQVEEMKEQFLSMVSHDLRTPMTSIRGILSLLNSGALGQISEKAQDRVNQAQVSCDRLMNLINDLLDIDKLEAGKMEMEIAQIGVSLVLEQSLNAVERYAEMSQVKVIAPNDSMLEIYADEARLVQVLVNLLSNAIKYSPPGECVAVEVVSILEFTEIRIIDKGRGVPDNMKEAIFERFRQVETADATKRGGTGLGLAICKAIVEQHGGSIGVISEAGKGSTFWIRIPSQAPPFEEVTNITAASGVSQ